MNEIKQIKKIYEIKALYKEAANMKINYSFNLDIDEYKDITINDEIVLHINRNDQGYSFDVYKANLYEEDNYDDGFITGTWFNSSEIEDIDE